MKGRRPVANLVGGWPGLRLWGRNDHLWAASLMRIVIDGGGSAPANRIALHALLDGWDSVGGDDELHVVSPLRRVARRCRSVSSVRRGGWRTVARVTRSVGADVVVHLGVGRPSVPEFPTVIVDPRRATSLGFAESVRRQAVRANWLSAGAGHPALLPLAGPGPGRPFATRRRHRTAWAPAARLAGAAGVLALSLAGTLSYAVVRGPVSLTPTAPTVTPSTGHFSARPTASGTSTSLPPAVASAGSASPTATVTTTPASAGSALSLPGVPLPDVTLPQLTLPTLPACTTNATVPVLSVPIPCSPLVALLCPCS